MDESIKNNINLFTHKLLNLKIINYEETDNYKDNLILFENFKTSYFWEICRNKNIKLCFLNDDITQNNLTKRLEKESNIFIFPKNKEIYDNNNKYIKFNDFFTFEHYQELYNAIKNINRNETKNIIIYNSINQKNISIFKDFNIPIFSFLNNDFTIKLPKTIHINNFITFVETYISTKKINIYYYGDYISLPETFHYCFINRAKISDNFLKISQQNIKQLFNRKKRLIDIYNRRKPKKIILPKTKEISNINSLDLNPNSIKFYDDPKKKKRVHMKDLKKYLEELNTIEYPIRTNIFKINFIIKSNPIINLYNYNELEWLEYNTIFNFIGDYLVYYNSVLLNDKINKKNFIDQEKFMKEFNQLKTNSMLFQDSIIKCPKDKFDLIFYIGDSEHDVDIYDRLPYPKILSGPIVPDYWNDDRHIISFPSTNYLDVLTSGIVKYNNETIKLPKRFIIKNQFLGPEINLGNFREEYLADYVIMLNTNDKTSIEISLIEGIIEKYRIEYNKEIVLLLTCDYESEKSWIKNINFRNYVGKVASLDMIIILDDIWENIYNYTYLFLESINCEIPILIAECPLIETDMMNYTGLFKGLRGNLVGISSVKNLFEKKIKNLIFDDIEEIDFIEVKKTTWNKEILNQYKNYFNDIISFLDNKNYKRNRVENDLHNDNGINFYYHENVNEINLPHIYSNIESFFEKIKDFRRILLISSDYPGYGGASSLNNEISKNLELKGHICKELYYLFPNTPESEAIQIINKFSSINKFDFENLQRKQFFHNNIRVVRFKDLLKDLNDMDYEPDLIILKNHLNGVVLPKKFNNIYYLVAGIYQNKLNKFFYNLTLEESENFINTKVIDTLLDSRIKGISNSIHTKDILQKNFNINTELFYINFLPYYPQKLKIATDFDKRQYDYGIICSDFTRPIKNLKNIIDDLFDKRKPTDKIIFIGKNSKKFISKDTTKNNTKNITCIDLVPNYLISDYLKKIKNIIINSYYESNSNLAIQAKFNGCNIIRKTISQNNKKLKILITSTQKPGYGGSATNAYKLTKWLRKLNYSVSVLFFNKYLINDVNIDNIDGCFVLRDDIKKRNFHNNLDKIKIKNNIVEYLNGYPDIIFAFNYYTPILSRLIFPYSYIYYYVVGNPVLSIGSESIISKEISIRKFLDKNFKLSEYNMEAFELEKLSLDCVDEVFIDQGKLNIETISKVHPEYKYLYNNYYNYGINILLPELHVYNNTKEFELVVISSNWERLVKNPKLVYQIYKFFPQYRKLVIGKNSNIFEMIPNTTCIDLVSYKEAQHYLSKSKLLLITSFSETGPNTMIEAFVNNCHVLASKNIGYLRYLNDYHMCEDVYDINEWKNKISYLINNFSFIPVPKIEAEDDKNRYLENIDNKNIDQKLNVLVVCGDKPYYGGAATNSYNLIKLLKTNNHNVTGLFISYQKDGLDDPDKLGNVEHIFLDDKIESSLNEWKTRNNICFDIIFCKNYKVFTIIKKLLPFIPIIYSPSGLRQLTANISKNKKFYLDLEKNNLKLNSSTDDFIHHDNWFQFIMKNDQLLENYALSNADYLLPNSNITYNIINKYYGLEITSKLLEPIYLSNIQFIQQSNFNFSKRQFDFAFIATNWKRATKNIWTAKSIIKKLKDTKYKILIVGDNHGLTESDNENLTIKKHVLREEMILLYQKIKTVVITSFYESNPNVLMEAIYCGCNVISSPNCGNAENLRKQLIVTNFNKIEAWISSMEVSSKKLFPYLGPTIDLAKQEFINIIKNKGFKQEAVGVYKVNAKWDLEKKIDRNNKLEYKWLTEKELSSFEEHEGRKTDIFTNIYMHMFQRMCEKLNFKNNHYIFVDETRDKNLRIKWKNINIWVLTTIEDVMIFNQARFYFVRGNYPNFYNKFIHSNAYSIYYPATSFKYNYNIKNNEKIIKRDLEYIFKRKYHPQYDNFSMVLHHEDENYHKQFINNKIIFFKKFGLSDTFNFTNKDRIYDIICVGQAVQKSKNHQLMFDFIKYCDENNINIKIAYVTNKEVLKTNYKNYYESKKVTFFDNLTPNELSNLYNQSKINLLFSHRDCVPRVIIESILCGCYNLSTDLLSDGKYYYDGICGELLSFDYTQVTMLSSGMISYISNDLLFKKIIKLTKNNYDYKNISNEGKKLYNLNNTINDIIKNL
jgi:hypothetical protein